MSSPYGKSVLGNGVRVVTGPMTGVRSASLIFFYDVGARYEPAENAGMSHFLEHMLFKGTERRPDPKTISEEIEGVGGMLNASTGRESTNYWCKVPSTHFASAFDVLADIVRNSTIDQVEFDKERSVIFEEIRSIDDAPEEQVHEIIDEVVWGDRDLGRSVAGTVDSVGRITRDGMVDFWRRNYRPDRLVIAASGDISHEQTVALAEQYFADLAPAGDGDSFARSGAEDAAADVMLLERDTEQAHLCISMPALPYSTERRYVQRVIDAALGHGMSARLFQEIREKRALAYSVGCYFRSYADVGQGVVYAGTDLQRVEQTIAASVGELKKLKDEGIPADELQRIKDLLQGGLLVGLEDSRSVASWIGSQELTYGEIKTPEEVMEKMARVTRDEVHELARELFRTDRMSLALIGPYTDPDAFRGLLAID